MKTPYDAALRLRQREIDDMRVQINVEINQLIVIDEQRDAIARQVIAEREIASRHPGISAHCFAARMQDQRAALGRERDARDGQLSALRAQAMAAYGLLTAIAAAADRHRAEAVRVATVAEQGQLDDFSAARFTRAQHALRRLRAMPSDDA